MKFLLFSFAALCAMSCIARAQRSHQIPGTPTRPAWPKQPTFGHRFRREPQGSLSIEGRQPLDGPNRNPSIDLSYNQRLIDNDRTTLDAYGGANLHDRHVSPQAGFNYEHKFDNDMFLRGQGQVQQGPRGRLEPSFGAGLGWRFRRSAMPEVEEEEEEIAEEFN